MYSIPHVAVDPLCTVEGCMEGFSTLFTHKTTSYPPLLQPWNDVVFKHVHLWQNCGRWKRCPIVAEKNIKNVYFLLVHRTHALYASHVLRCSTHIHYNINYDSIIIINHNYVQLNSNKTKTIVLLLPGQFVTLFFYSVAQQTSVTIFFLWLTHNKFTYSIILFVFHTNIFRCWYSLDLCQSNFFYWVNVDFWCRSKHFLASLNSTVIPRQWCNLPKSFILNFDSKRFVSSIFSFVLETIIKSSTYYTASIVTILHKNARICSTLFKFNWFHMLVFFQHWGDCLSPYSVLFNLQTIFSV